MLLQTFLMFKCPDVLQLDCREVVSSTPIGEEAYGDRCLAAVDESEVAKSPEKPKSKFKFRSDIGIGSRSVP